MAEELPLFFQALVWLNLYWYVFLGTFVPGIYYIFIKIITFPLAANKAHEFVIIAKPEKVAIKKVVNRLNPFFEFKKGIYWFSTPCGDVDNFSKYHVYIEGINQDLTDMERREGKLDDILSTYKTSKQVAGHMVKIPIKIKDHLHRHWAITIDPLNKVAKVTKVREAQPFRLSLYHTIGIYTQEQEQVEVEREVEGAQNTGAILNQVTNETVISQVKYVQQVSYFSSSSAFGLWKKRLKIETMFVNWVKGSLLDPKIMGAMVLMMAAIGAVMLVMFALPGATLGEMPTS